MQAICDPTLEARAATVAALAAGHLVLDGPTETIADGLVAQLSDGTLAILLARAGQVVTVTEDQIVDGMRRFAVDAKRLVEPSGAVAIAGPQQLAASGADLPADVGVIVSGGNVNLEHWAELLLGPSRA